MNRFETLKRMVAGQKVHIVIENLFLLLFFGYIGLSFETNDDIGLRIVVSGVYGENSPYMRVSSSILGFILSHLYEIMPQINWYSLSTVVIIFVSLCVITYLIETLLEETVIGWIKYPFMIIVGYELYCSAQFTKTAGIACVAGFSLFIVTMNRIVCDDFLTNSNKEYIIFLKLLRALWKSMLLILVGAMVRLTAAKLVAVFFGGAIAILLAKEIIKRNGQMVICFLTGLGLIFMIFFSIIVMDWVSYELNHEQKTYKEWYEAVIKCVDYDIPEYWEATEYYESLGLNSSDFYMLRGWYFGDTEFFTVDLLNSISAAKKVDNSTLNRVKDVGGRLPQIIIGRLEEKIFLLCIFVTIVYFIFSSRELLPSLIVCGEWGASVMALAYFSYVGRMMKRVNSVMWISIILIIVLCMGLGERKHNFTLTKGTGVMKNTCTIIVMLLIMNLPMYFNKSIQIRTSNNNIIDLKERSFYISHDKGKLYVNDADNIVEKAWSEFWDVLPQGVRFNNVVDSNGWLCGMPFWYANMHRHGVYNIYRDTMDKDVIFMSNDNRMPSIIRFINEHYHPEARYMKIAEFCDQPTFYKIISDINKKALIIENLKQNDELGEINYQVDIFEDEEKISISGTAFKSGLDSYYQSVYVVLTDKETHEYESFETVKKQISRDEDVLNGKYGGFYVDINKQDVDFDKYDIAVFLVCDNTLYLIPVEQ